MVVGTTAAGCRPTADPTAPSVGVAPEHPADGAHGSTPQAIDPNDEAALDAALRGDGLVGWMHGAVEATGAVTFTYRHPDDFFAFVILPAVGDTTPADDALRALRRHDKIRVFGQLSVDGAPVRHIVVTRHEMVEPYRPPAEVHDYAYATTLPPGLVKGAEPQPLVVKVHAVSDEPHVLVVEYGDQVLPVFVSGGSAANGLYRGDKVRLWVEVAQHPSRPAHLVLAERPDAVEMLDAILAQHGKPVELQGPLVLYPDSPALLFDIFALHDVDAQGLTRDYTLVNFTDIELFKSMRQRLADTWAAHADESVNRRNKRVSTRIIVRARGTMNMQDPNQANPQILIASPEDLEIEVLPQALPYEELVAREAKSLGDQ